MVAVINQRVKTRSKILNKPPQLVHSFCFFIPLSSSLDLKIQPSVQTLEHQRKNLAKLNNFFFRIDDTTSFPPIKKLKLFCFTASNASHLRNNFPQRDYICSYCTLRVTPPLISVFFISQKKKHT